MRIMGMSTRMAVIGTCLGIMLAAGWPLPAFAGGGEGQGNNGRQDARPAQERPDRERGGIICGPGWPVRLYASKTAPSTQEFRQAYVRQLNIDLLKIFKDLRPSHAALAAIRELGEMQSDGEISAEEMRRAQSIREQFFGCSLCFSIRGPRWVIEHQERRWERGGYQ